MIELDRYDVLSAPNRPQSLYPGIILLDLIEVQFKIHHLERDTELLPQSLRDLILVQMAFLVVALS